MYDIKRRPEIGFQDIDKYDFGGFDIDEQLTNGYHLYIPYGIHVNFFEAINDSIRILHNERENCREKIGILNKEILNLEEKYRDTAKYTIRLQEDSIKRIDRDLKILEKFVQLENEV